MSKVEVVDRKYKVYRPVQIILETEEEFINVWNVFNEGGNKVYDVWNQMDVVANKEEIRVRR